MPGRIVVTVHSWSSFPTNLCWKSSFGAQPQRISKHRDCHRQSLPTGKRYMTLHHSGLSHWRRLRVQNGPRMLFHCFSLSKSDLEINIVLRKRSKSAGGFGFATRLTKSYRSPASALSLPRSTKSCTQRSPKSS